MWTWTWAGLVCQELLTAGLWATCAVALAWTLPFQTIFKYDAQVLMTGTEKFRVMDWAWLGGAAGYVVVVWGLAGAAAQRAGYQLSWSELLAKGMPWGKKVMSKFGVNEDPGELLYPAGKLQLEKRQYCLNALLWVGTLLLKVAFEYFLIIWPLTEVMLKVRVCCQEGCRGLLLRNSLGQGCGGLPCMNSLG